MRKHLLLIITLLCAVVQGLWAQTSTVSYIWYSLDGRKLTSEPAQKGIYIHNGRKTVIK